MWPSTSAYTTFWEGASKGANASLKLFQSPARWRRSSPSAAPPGCSAVHCSASPRQMDRSGSSIRSTTGPCRVTTTSSSTSDEPLTWMISRSLRVGSNPRSVLNRSPAGESNSSITRSWQSAKELVNPQATRLLWPMITNGMPGMVTPVDSKSSPAWTWAAYQIDGIPGTRCGSLQRIGRPVAFALRTRPRSCSSHRLSGSSEPPRETSTAAASGCRHRPPREASRPGWSGWRRDRRCRAGRRARGRSREAARGAAAPRPSSCSSRARAA